MRSLALLVAVLLVHHEARGDPEFEWSDGADESARIVQGVPAREGQFPWMVAIFYIDQNVCSGSIISDRAVMTSAHCVVIRGREQPAFLYYGIANVNSSSPYQLIEFSRIIVHPGYDEVHHDIAILRTSSDIIFDENIHPVCIAAPNTRDDRYWKAIAMGYGRTSIYNDSLPELLHWTEQKIMPNAVCQLFVRGIDNNKLCAMGIHFSNWTFNSVCHDLVKMDKMMIDADEELDPRVIGGRDALDKEFPWMVALHYQGRFVCSSFLVTPKVLMTAAHCVVFGNQPEDPKSYNAYVGTIHRDGPEKEILFTEIIAHKDYGSNTEYDIALMRLAEPVTLSDNVQTVCLPTKNSLYENMNAQVMGWGVTDKGGRESAKILQTATEHIPTNALCSFTYGILGIPVTRRHVCAGGENDKGICFGDSGGPLVAMNETQPIAIGVASFGSYLGCAAGSVPAVYTSTAMYTDWIVANVGDEANNLCFQNRTSQPVRRWG